MELWHAPGVRTSGMVWGRVLERAQGARLHGRCSGGGGEGLGQLGQEEGGWAKGGWAKPTRIEVWIFKSSEKLLREF